MISMYYVAVISLIAAFIVLLIKKWGWAEWVQVHGDKVLSQLFSCDLCMSFWAAVLVSIIMVLATGNSALIFVPVLSTPITRILL